MCTPREVLVLIFFFFFPQMPTIMLMVIPALLGVFAKQKQQLNVLKLLHCLKFLLKKKN